MNLVVCNRCGEAWPVLHDGTLVEHPLQESPALLCPGSRTKAAPQGEDGDRAAPATSTAPKHKAVPSAN